MSHPMTVDLNSERGQARRVFSSETLGARVRRLQEKMLERRIDGVLIKQNADLFYFSGTTQDAYLFIPLRDRPILMVRRNPVRAGQESTLDRIVPLESSTGILRIINDYGLPVPEVMGLELDVCPVKFYLRIRELFSKTTLVDISSSIREIRSVKSPEEIAFMREAALQLDGVIRQVPELLCRGMTELELASEVEYRLRRSGHQGFMRMRAWNQELFFGHILSGPAGAEPSYFLGATGGIGVSSAFGQGASKRRISKGEPVSIDMGGCINGYMIDQTRMFSIGEFPSDLKKAYDAVRGIHHSLREEIKPGRTCGDVYESACRKAASYGYGEYFMGYGSSKMPFIGHGIGLEVDELPVLSYKNPMVLEAGMTVAVEPKLIFPGIGHVGIEDTYVITPDGLEPLTVSCDEWIIVKPSV